MKSVFLAAVFVAVLLATAITSTAHAAPYTTFGAPDCGQWTTSASTTRKAWLLGFMSGLAARHAALGGSPTDPLNALSSSDQVLVWMTNYCKENPLSSVNEGGTRLFTELISRKK